MMPKPHHSYHRRKCCAFTLMELLIVIAIISLLVSIAAPQYVRSREAARRMRCASQVRHLIQCCKLYAQDNHGRWPNAFVPDSLYADRLPDEPDPAVGLRGENEEDDALGTDNIGQVAESTSASLWLLVAGDYAPAEAFICPSTADVIDEIRNPDEVRDFLSRQHCSYSYQCLRGGRAMRDSHHLAVLADRSPFFDPYDEADEPEANSFNHWGEGQNVGFADGHVQWFTEPRHKAAGDWFYLPRNEDDEADPGDIPDGESLPVDKDDALLM